MCKYCTESRDTILLQCIQAVIDCQRKGVELEAVWKGNENGQSLCREFSVELNAPNRTIVPAHLNWLNQSLTNL